MSTASKEIMKTVAIWLISQIKVKSSLILIISGLFVTFIYIFMVNTPYIKLNGITERIDLYIDRKFSTMTLYFNNKIEVSKYTFQIADMKGKIQRIKSREIMQKLKELRIDNLLYEELRDKYDAPTPISVKIFCIPKYSIELNEVRVDEQKYDLRTFYENNLRVENKSFMTVRYIREDISNLILQINDPVSNVFITLLTLLFFWLLIELIITSRHYFLKKVFEKHIRNTIRVSAEANSHDIINVRHRYGAEFSRRDSRLRFYQILGPAAGFALTISSLIVGLHPLFRETGDVYKFFDSIQIAMVSTLVGLLIRVFAVLLQRMHNTLFLRADEIFFYLEEKEK